MRRAKKIVQELLRAQNDFATPKIRVNLVPPKAIIQKNGRSKVIPIALPKYVSPRDLPKESKHTFVEICTPEEFYWLQAFSESILNSEKDTRYPLTNPEFDFHNPEISGFRLYLKNFGITHIQVSRVPGSNSLFQLDYFEIPKIRISGPSKKYSNIKKKFKVMKKWHSKKVPKVLMVVVVDISENDFHSINLVYASSDLELMEETMSKSESELDYARKAAIIFRYIQVYMRNWDFSVSCNHCKIHPLEYFGKKIEVKSAS